MEGLQVHTSEHLLTSDPETLLKHPERYGIATSSIVPEQAIGKYWIDLYKADLLKYRWCDINPLDLSLNDIKNYSIDNGHTYFVVDTKELKLIGEFTLTNFTGAAAQVHVSTHPGNHPGINRKLGKEITDKVLYQWKKPNTELPFLDTLYGLTPEPNRAARLYLLRAGFKNMGVLISGTKYEGDVCDAIMSMKTRTN